MELRIGALLSTERIAINALPKGRMEAIDALLDLHTRSGVLTDPARYKADVLLREAEGSTALGRELAIPHAKSAGVLHPALCAMTAPRGVEWDAPDRGPARLLFMIAAPIEGGDLHLQILSRLMRLLIYSDLPARLVAAGTPQAFLAAIEAEEHAVERNYGGPSYGQ